MSETASAEKHFVVDSMLGKLAKWLRVIGFDTRCEPLTRLEKLREYQEAGCFLITRNRRWCGQRQVLCLSANDPAEQLREVIAALCVTPKEIRPLLRCILCNHELHPISPNVAFGHVPDFVFETNTQFHQCPGCQRVYWRGSHPQRMMDRLERLLGWSLNVTT